MTSQPSIEARLAALLGAYGDGADGAVPTAEQWRRLLDRPAAPPPTLVNLFALRDRARYQAGSPDASLEVSGEEAFARYTQVSVPTLEKVGGRFLFVGPGRGSLVGEDEDWDLVAIGAYPDAEAVLALFEDAAYQRAFRHRVAACARQRVLLAG